MAPITAMRNALGSFPSVIFSLFYVILFLHMHSGIAEGGSGVPLDREKYEQSAAFWQTHINVDDDD